MTMDLQARGPQSQERVNCLELQLLQTVTVDRFKYGETSGRLFKAIQQKA